MPDLIFASRGQAEALAAQEQVAAAARKARAEFEEGAKATKAWDADTARLARTSESALRSVQTEQEKIAEKISLINERQQKGIGDTEENARAIGRLRGKWVEAGQEGSRVADVFQKAFDPIKLAKFAAGFVGVGAAIRLIKEQFEDFQVGVDKRVEAALKPQEKLKKIEQDIVSAQQEATQAQERLVQQQNRLRDAGSRSQEGAAERQASIRQQIADAQLDLSRAQEDRSADEAERQNQIKAAKQDLGEARQDYWQADTEASARGGERRIADIEARLQELRGKGESVQSQRRIADIQERIRRLEKDLTNAAVADGLVAESAAVGFAQEDVGAAQRRLLDLESARDALKKTPEFRRSAQVADRQRALDEGYDQLSQLGDINQMSRQELEKFADIMRELGQGPLSRRLAGLAQRATDGTVSQQEVAALLRGAADSLQKKAVPGAAPLGGVYAPQYQLVPVSSLSEREQLMNQYLKRIADTLDRQEQRDNGLVGTSE